MFDKFHIGATNMSFTTICCPT